ncbi:phage tail tape measure protein [Cytobacillus firmus]|uniref:phage tail tape measure protein n=1 Tax=Cytobacillus firmus TaxID=1399 RepID=UPI00203E289D|nr:phage tail tape measure protein [Cytobacillus firmus]MCM3705313.1 phage tail tape measure protein [Cytobacillus firmus]
MADGRIEIDTRINDDGVEQGFRDLQTRMSEVGESLRTTGENLSKYLSLPLTAVGGAAGKMANDTQVALGRIQSGLGITRTEAQKLLDIAQDVWVDGWGESLEDVADSIVNVKHNLGDLNKEDLANVTKGAYLLSQRFDADLNESTRAAGQLMKDFGIDSSKAMDMLTWGFQNGLDYTGEFLDTIREYSPQFSELGYTGEQTLNALKAGFDAGAWSLDKVGDAIKESHLRMGALDKATVEAYKSMGLNAEEYVGKIAKGGEEGNKAFQEIVKKLMEVEDATLRNQLATDLFGTQYEDLREKVIFAMAGAETGIKGLEGTTQRAADALHDNFGERLQKSFRKMMSSLEPLGHILLDMADRVLPKVNNAIKQLSDWFNNLSPTAQNVVVVIGLILAALGPLLMIIGFVAQGVGVLAGLFGSITAPIALVIAGIALLVGALVAAYTNSETFREKVNGAFLKIKEIGLQVFEVVASFIGEKIAQIKQFWDEVGPQFLEAVTNVFNGIKAVIDFVMPAVLFVVQMVWDSIKGVINGALDIIMGAIKVFSGLFTGDWSMMWDGIKQLLGGAVEFIWNLLNLMFIGRILKGIGAFVKGGVNLIKEFGTKIINFFKNTWNGAWNLVDDFVDAVITLFNLFRTRGNSIFQSFSGVIKSIFTSIKTGVVNTAQGLRDRAVSIFEGMKTTVSTIFNKIKDFITNPIETAKDTVLGIIDTIVRAFNKMKIKIPKPKLPKVSVSMKTGFMGVQYPDFDVQWLAKGGIVPPNSPGLYGLGDNKMYDEAAIPLSPSVLGMIGQKIADNMPGSNVPAGEVTKQIHLHMPNVRNERDARSISIKLADLESRHNRVGGGN